MTRITNQKLQEKDAVLVFSKGSVTGKDDKVVEDFTRGRFEVKVEEIVGGFDRDCSVEC